MNKFIERHSVHTWDKLSGIVEIPNSFRLVSDDNKIHLSIETAKHKGMWFVGFYVSPPTLSVGNRLIMGYPCCFNQQGHKSEVEAFREAVDSIREQRAKLPKSWWKEIEFHLVSLYVR